MSWLMMMAGVFAGFTSTVHDRIGLVTIFHLGVEFDPEIFRVGKEGREVDGEIGDQDQGRPDPSQIDFTAIFGTHHDPRLNQRTTGIKLESWVGW